MKETYEALKEYRKQNHQKWLESNLNILEASELEFSFKDTVCLFREKDKPKVDFYPHTGRWKVKNKMHRGGALSFLNWYKKQ